MEQNKVSRNLPVFKFLEVLTPYLTPVHQTYIQKYKTFFNDKQMIMFRKSLQIFTFPDPQSYPSTTKILKNKKTFKQQKNTTMNIIMFRENGKFSHFLTPNLTPVHQLFSKMKHDK